MIGTIMPAVRRHRATSRIAIAAVYSAAAAGTSAVVFVVVERLGHGAVRGNSSAFAALWGFAAVVAIYGAGELSFRGSPFPSRRWQIPATIGARSDVLKAASWGALLGAAPLTVMPSPGYYAVVLFGAWSGLNTALVLGASYGVVVSLPVVRRSVRRVGDAREPGAAIVLRLFWRYVSALGMLSLASAVVGSAVW